MKILILDANNVMMNTFLILKGFVSKGIIFHNAKNMKIMPIYVKYAKINIMSKMDYAYKEQNYFLIV